MAVKPFSKEKLNFFKFSSIVLDEFPKAVRQIFVTLWDSKIAVLPGYPVWDDSTAVRNMLLKSEGGKTSIPINQSIDKWDCTALFKATIYAKMFGFWSRKGPTKTLNDLYLKNKKPVPGSFHPSVNSPTGNQDETYALAIDQIRLLRNTLCHSAQSEISKADFDQFVQLAKDALTAAKVITASIDAIGGLTEDDFPTEKQEKLKESLLKELQANNQFLQGNMMDMISEMHEHMKTSGEPTHTVCKASTPERVLPSEGAHEEGAPSEKRAIAEGESQVDTNATAKSSSMSTQHTGSVVDDDLREIAKKIPKDWKRLGRKLLDDFAVDRIDEDEKEVFEKANKMLKKWKQTKGNDATYEYLYNALCQAERKDLAEKYCLEHS